MRLICQLRVPPKLKTVFYKQQNYFEKMMGIMLEWYHLLIGMQTTVLLTIAFTVPC